MIDLPSVDPFVEKSAEYYFSKWTAMDNDSGSRVSWNWAAAIGGVVWMVYRGLYLPLAIVLLVGFVDIYITVELEDAGVLPTAVAIWDRASVWVYSAVFGSWGNYWYFQKFKKANSTANHLFVDPNDRHDYLAQEGGTSILIAGIALLTVSALAIWMVIEL